MRQRDEAQRIEGVDFLRGLSIIWVVLMHVNQRASIEKTFIGKWVHPQLLSCVFKNGYLGVIVFFVVSGFLITSSSIKRWGGLRNIDPKQFYLFRFARIAPCLLALIAILNVLHGLGLSQFLIDSHKASLARVNFSALTFHLNWLEAKVGYLPASWDVLWSLSVEETFYLFFPLVCVLLKGSIPFVLFMSSFILIGPFARTLITNEIWQDHSYLSCMDGIAIGCLTAVFIEKFKLSKNALKWITWIGLTSFILSVLCKRQIFQMGLSNIGLNVTLLEVATAFLIVSICGHKHQTGIFSSQITFPIRWFGKNSYEIYLTHMLVVALFVGTPFMDQYRTPLLLLGFPLILISTGIVGHLIAKIFSEPSNKQLRYRLIKVALNTSLW